MRRFIRNGVCRSSVSVLHVITRLDMGGSAQNTLQSCVGLSSRYRVHLGYGLARESGMTEAEIESVDRNVAGARSEGVSTAVLPHLVRAIHPLRDLVSLGSLVRYIISKSPAIVHTHTSKAGLIGRIAAKAAGVPIVVHTPHGHVFYGHFGPVASRLFLWIERALDRFTDVTVALTRGEYDDYVRLNVAPQHKLTIIHSGVDIDRFSRNQEGDEDLRRELGIPAKAPVVGFVGWLLPIKGPDLLIEAMKTVWVSLPEVHLVLVGKGEMRRDLESRVRAIGKGNQVHFLGWRQDIENIMPVFDVFVLPSRNEGMGRVIVEAMAAGKPIVASRVGGIPDLVEHGVNGFLFPSENVGDLAKAIKKLIQDPSLARRMGQAGREKAKQFSTGAMITKLDELYQALLRKAMTP